MIQTSHQKISNQSDSPITQGQDGSNLKYMANSTSIAMSTSNAKPWTKWHLRLHKKLLANKSLIPERACLILAISGGQDSMALLQLMLDLKRLHLWELNIWHGDHCWHEKSKKIAEELKQWCEAKNLRFFANSAIKGQLHNEAIARDWRYFHLAKTAELLASKKKGNSSQYILTGHTSTDRAETLLLNLARGTDLAGLSSLREVRNQKENVYLVRPLLGYTRTETAQICEEMKLPIWIDPSNKNINLRRNQIREQIFPILEEMYPGCSNRMASLSERLSHYKEDQHSMAMLLIKTLETPQGLCRKTLSKLSTSARRTILAEWLLSKGINNIKAAQLEEISVKTGAHKTPGSQAIGNKWRIKWFKESIQIIKSSESK